MTDGTGAVSLGALSVQGASVDIKTTGAGSAHLGKLAIAGTATKGRATAAVTLGTFTVAGAGKSGITQRGSGAAALGSLSTASAGNGVTVGAAITLGGVRAAGVGKSGITQSGMGAVTLAGPSVAGSMANKFYGLKPSVICVTGLIRATGSAIFQFQGQPGMGVQWSIAAGSGALYPLSQITDEVGQAFCRYDAGGYEGPLKVQVSYGS